MSEKEVVAIESNPTGEDLSIDNAINSLYESMEEKEVSSDVEVKAEAEAEIEQEADDSPEEVEAFSFPENMPKELQESLSKLDEDAQKQGVEVFKKMQGSFTKKNQEFAEEKKLAESINKVFEDNNYNVASVEHKQKLISNYVAFDKLIVNDPKAAVKQLLDYTGLKPEDFGISQTPTDSSDEYLTDTELKLKTQINALESQIKAITQEKAISKEREQFDIVKSFREAKNEQGELLNPHFDAVKSDMMDLADVNPNLTIEQLYAKAVRMNDDLFNKTIEQERQKALSAVEAKRREEVEKAKKLNRQSRPNSSIDSKVVDMDAIFDQIATNAGFN